MSSPFGPERDHYYMKQALAQASKAFDRGEVPVGAVVVNADGLIIGRGYNQVEKRDTQSAHAEGIAIAKAGRKQGDWRLIGCWLYVTLEPCSMCMNLVRLSRISGVFFGAKSPLFGYQLDKEGGYQLYNENVVDVEVGLGAEEAATLLKDFFKKRRKEKRLGCEEK